MNLSRYINNLKEYRKKSLEALKKQWNPKKELFEKVDKNGNYKEFKGDTIVFSLNKEDIEKVYTIQKKLYSEIPDLLAKPLSKKYFHLTLHDLCNTSTTNNIKNCMEYNKKIIPEIFKTLPKRKIIKMSSIGLYNGGSAIGIMFAPVDATVEILFNIRNVFDKLIKLERLFIPHVTLGYYLPRDYTEIERKEIISTLENMKVDIDISLELSRLTYQIFHTMDLYESVYKNE
ncbi:hypothetical protein JYK00_07415 [Thermosipho ferrireducens]|uniref:2'-5' RNA ligase n=1 Tax=Thermosipho ferrireducens TaxID=2571116 RepID=A0ABX7S4Z4_9BACT|nr:hypothetical protein [Thermosipho ferrireducens]QTA37552.1 hypothetical protein JYK00_07415 [Thermosipho ferrireducens]